MIQSWLMSREIVEEVQRDAGDGAVFWNKFGR